MKLKDYLEDLQSLVEVNPELLEMDIITASDDEGNSFNGVVYEASAGYFDGDDKTFIAESECDFVDNEYEINAICLN